MRYSTFSLLWNSKYSKFSIFQIYEIFYISHIWKFLYFKYMKIPVFEMCESFHIWNIWKFLYSKYMKNFMILSWLNFILKINFVQKGNRIFCVADLNFLKKRSEADLITGWVLIPLFSGFFSLWSFVICIKLVYLVPIVI